MAGQVGAALNVVKVLGLHLLLVRLAVVKVVEVGHNDGDGEGNGQHPGNGTQGPYYLPPHTHRPGESKKKKGFYYLFN